MKSWIDIKPDSDFSLYNIPFGIGVIPDKGPGICTRIGDWVVDLASMANLAFFDRDLIDDSVFITTELNGFISKGKHVTGHVRKVVQDCFLESDNDESKASFFKQYILHHADSIQMLMPLQVGDYTDFYSSIEHATNVGIMFRDPANALLPNWKHIPVGYHGRASSIVVSGTEIYRPKGQTC